MKIYIMTDMEGVCGVLNHDDWVMPSGRYYEEGKKLLTLEVNAAVEGFLSEGATQVLVVDGHGAGGLIPGSGDECDCDTYRNRNTAAVHLHPQKARDMICEGAAKSIRKFKQDKELFKLIEIKPPFRRDTSYRQNNEKPACKVYSEDPSDLIGMLNT